MNLRIGFLFCCFCSSILSWGQQDTSLTASEREELKQLFQSKQIMMASLGMYQSSPAFLQKANRAGQYNSFWFQDSYFLLGYGQSKTLTPSSYTSNRTDTLAINDFSIGLQFAFNKASIGHRLWDIKGALLTPSLGVCYNRLTINNEHISGIKLIPALSLQLPYMAIDARINVDLRGGNMPQVNKTAIYPEIGIRLDGLYNILDPFEVTNGHYEGTRQWKTVDISTHYERDENSKDLYEVTVKTTTYHTENYNFDAYARDIGPFVAIGPRYTYNNLEYAGNTRMLGLGYFARMPKFGVDFYADLGKLGFASQYTKKETLNQPKPDDNEIDKKDAKFSGTYDAKRIGGKVSLDLVELIMNAAYRSNGTGGNVATKFSRVMCGIGGGYAFLSNPTYARSYAPLMLDSLSNANYTLLTTAVNDARFGENTTYFSYFISFEVGVVELSLEAYRYKYAPLANVRTVSLSYMLPYNRLAKRYKNLRRINAAMRNN